jgi:hypothetical protein
MLTHPAIERLLHGLAERQQDVIAGQVVLRVTWNRWRVGDGEALSLAVATDRLRAAARSLEAKRQNDYKYFGFPNC